MLILLIIKQILEIRTKAWSSLQFTRHFLYRLIAQHYSERNLICPCSQMRAVESSRIIAFAWCVDIARMCLADRRHHEASGGCPGLPPRRMYSPRLHSPLHSLHSPPTPDPFKLPSIMLRSYVAPTINYDIADDHVT